MNRARAAGGATVSRVLSGRAMNVRRTSTAAVRSGALLPRTAAVARRAASSSSSGADMRAVVVTDWVEEPRALRVARTEQPELFDGAVKVKVAAAGVNFFDSLMIAGKYQIKPPLPFVPGGEFSGVVTEVSDGVEDFAVGDRVFGGLATGGFGEYVVVGSQFVRKVPEGLTLRDAAGLFVTLPTSYSALALRARLQPGETCLVLGAAGGVGIYAVQIAKALGARVIALAGSDDKLKVCSQHGADDVVNYSSDDWVARVKELTAGEGVDVVYDPVGFATECTKCMAWNGRYVVVGFAAGTIPKVALNRVLLKNISLVGLHWGAYLQNEPEAIPAVWRDIDDLIARGDVKPVVFPKAFSLEETGEALHEVATRGTYSKVIIDVDKEVDTASRSRL